MSFVCSIFTLKPVIDLLHEDVLQLCQKNKELKDRIAELEKENAMLRDVNHTKMKVEPDTTVVKVEPVIPKRTKPRVAKPKEVIVIDDEYAAEAETFDEKPVNVIVQPTTEKVVVVQDEKTRKEYQKEYQRNYRKLKKEKAAGTNS